MRSLLVGWESLDGLLFVQGGPTVFVRCSGRVDREIKRKRETGRKAGRRVELGGNGKKQRETEREGNEEEEEEEEVVVVKPVRERRLQWFTGILLSPTRTRTHMHAHASSPLHPLLVSLSSSLLLRFGFLLFLRSSPNSRSPSSCFSVFFF